MDRRHAILCIGACMAGLYQNIARAGVMEAIHSSGVLRVAVLDNYPPWGSIDSSMKPVGLDIDLAHLLANKLGLHKVRLVATSGANRIPFLQTHKVDVIIACLGKNSEREKVVDFSIPYASEFNGVFGDPGLVITAPSDLVGKTIGVARGSTEEVSLLKVAPPGAKILRYEDSSTSVQAYFSGKVQLIAIGSTVVANLKKTHPSRKIAFKFKLAEEPTYIGINKNEPEFLAAINKALAEMKADGSIEHLKKKWLIN